jgi:TolB-like protein
MTVCAPDRWGEAEEKAIRDQLARILQSRPFVQSRRRQRFLEYLVSEALAGRSDRLKGYKVGVEVFGRPETFDPAVDPVVRIEAGRLREKLAEYYQSDGQSDPVRIDLPKGTYAPHIEFRQTSSPEAGPKRMQAMARETVSLVNGRPALAVLPFANMGPNRDYDYLADGFADSLITELAKVSGLFVISRHSSFAHRHSHRSLPDIAAALRVRYLIEGSVRTEKKRLRISVSLIDTASDHSIWTERYERRFRDFFAIQDDVCLSIVRALRVQLTPSETSRVGQEDTQNSDAHDELLRGLEKFWLYSRESCEVAQRHFLEAVALDPNYAAAHAWLARTYVFQYSMCWNSDPKATMEPALEHARHAVALDAQSPYAHSMLGWVLLYLKDGETAVSEGRRGCALDPDSPDAKLFLSLILASTGHAGEAMRTIETAMLLQPHPSSFYFYALGVCRFAIADYERAIAAFLKGIEINPSFMPNHYVLSIVYGVSGLEEAAQSEAALVKEDWPNASKQFFIDPALAEIYLRGKQVAGLD